MFGLTCIPRIPHVLARILYVKLTLAKHDPVFFVNMWENNKEKRTRNTDWENDENLKANIRKFVLQNVTIA